MRKIKILHLHSGIGGCRLYWDDIEGVEIEVTAVELDPAIAEAYQSRFPNDTVVVGDAKQYLLNHYKEFGFVWASPPCQSHSTIINSQYTRDSYKAKYPDMSLYEIILFLQFHAKDKIWCVENVIPYYKELIPPSVIIDRHFYWSNFNIPAIDVEKKHIIKHVTKKDAPFNLDEFGIKDQRQVIRNQVDCDVGKYILECALNKVQHKQNGLF